MPPTRRIQVLPLQILLSLLCLKSTGFHALPRNFDSPNLDKESACQCRRCRLDIWIGKTPLEKKIATHSSILAWEIPWTEEPGRLQSTGLQRVGHNLATKQQNLGQGLEINVSDRLDYDSHVAGPEFGEYWYCLQSSSVKQLNQARPERTVLAQVTQWTCAGKKAQSFVLRILVLIPSYFSSSLDRSWSHWFEILLLY